MPTKRPWAGSAALAVGAAASTALVMWAVGTLDHSASAPHVEPKSEPTPVVVEAAPRADSTLGEQFAARDRMNRAMADEFQRAPRQEGDLDEHLDTLRKRARDQGFVGAVEFGSGLAALERAGAPPDEIEAFAREMEALSAELRGDALPEGPPRVNPNTDDVRELIIQTEGADPREAPDAGERLAERDDHAGRPAGR